MKRHAQTTDDQTAGLSNLHVEVNVLARLVRSTSSSIKSIWSKLSSNSTPPPLHLLIQRLRQFARWAVKSLLLTGLGTQRHPARSEVAVCSNYPSNLQDSLPSMMLETSSTNSPPPATASPLASPVGQISKRLSPESKSTPETKSTCTPSRLPPLARACSTSPSKSFEREDPDRSSLNDSLPGSGSEELYVEESWPVLGLPEGSPKETSPGRIQTCPAKFLQERIKEEIILPSGEDWWWGEAEKASISQPFFR